MWGNSWSNETLLESHTEVAGCRPAEQLTMQYIAFIRRCDIETEFFFGSRTAEISTSGHCDGGVYNCMIRVQNAPL